MTENGETRGMTQRDLLLEVRGDVKKLMEANLIQRIDNIEESQRWNNRALAAQFLALLGGVVLVVIK